MFAGNFEPVGWAFCSGQLLAIDQNPTLFQLIGTTYGGDGQSTFALPDLRGRIPLDVGNGFQIGETGGTETVTLSSNQIPSHRHPMLSSSSAGASSAPAGNIPAAWSSDQYATGGAPVAMGAAIGSDGGSQPHDNMAPYLVVNFIISLFGIFPSQS
jgi:microcystin-dependent protein